MQARPKARTLRTSGIAFPELCRTLFESVSATGSNVWGPACMTSRPRTSAFIQTLELPAIERLEFVENCDNPSMGSTSRGDVPSPGTESYSNVQKPTRKRKQQLNSDFESKLDKLADILIEKHSGATLEDCTDKLERLGWDNNDPLHLTATMIFGESQNYRDLWMHLDENNHTRLETWVRRVGSKLGYL